MWKRNNNLSAFESIIKKCIHENEITISSKNTARRFLDVCDLSQVIVDNAYSEKSGIYNLSGSRLISLEDIILNCEVILNKKIKIIELNSSLPTVRNIYSCHDRYMNIDQIDLTAKINEFLNFYVS